MGLFKTKHEAMNERGPAASWKQRIITRVTLGDGKVYWRTTVFDTSIHKCKRCRKAPNQCKADGSDGGRHRVACTGHFCDICGNPYASFSRQGRLGRLSPNNPHAVNKGWWLESGRLH